MSSRGALTVTLRDGEHLTITTPEGAEVVVECTKAKTRRVTLRIEAPRDVNIVRETANPRDPK